MNNDLDLSLLTENELCLLYALQIKALGYDVQRLFNHMNDVLRQIEPGEITHDQVTSRAFERYRAEQEIGREKLRRAAARSVVAIVQERKITHE